jgi:hypothetical protein
MVYPFAPNKGGDFTLPRNFSQLKSEKKEAYLFSHLLYDVKNPQKVFHQISEIENSGCWRKKPLG